MNFHKLEFGTAKIHFCTALLSLLLATAWNPPAKGQQPYDSVGPVNVYPGSFGDPTLALPNFTAATQTYYYLLLKQDPSNPSTTSDLEVQTSGNLSLSGDSTPPMNGSLLQWDSETGAISVTQVGTYEAIDWTANSVPGSTDQLGVATLSVNGLPSKQNNLGENVSIDWGQGNSLSATLAQPYLPGFPGTTTTLSPAGLRTAQLSGIQAVSYGLQDNGASTTSAGGNVSVTTENNSSITVASDDPIVLTAGISAASAAGGGNNDGINTIQAVTVNHGGSIVNNSPQGIGIMAVTTGANFASSGDTVAVGAPVTVNLNGNASISVTGTNSIGVFAVSEAYTASEPKKNTSVAGGTVTGTIGAGTTITTGSGTSNFSVGYLGVSTGTDGLINPFTTQSVNKTGSGNGGQVTITNNGTVNSSGTMSIGIAALSTGGAGIATNTDATANGYSYVGNSGGSSDGNGDQVTVINNGSIVTSGISAYGIIGISSGGGGIINNDLAGSSSAGLIIGDNNTSNSDPASNGGAVGVVNNGSIQTGNGDGSGAASIAVIAQSIGGSGGSAGGQHAALFAGDSGGGGGLGGTVTVTTGTFSSITTNDTNNLGILAQSIGGGGGNGGNAEGLFVAVGGRGGNGGNGGQVNIDLSGTISTSADHSAAVIGQSIGGGGGNGGGATSIGFFVDASIGGKGGHGGAGATTTGTLETSGSIHTLGNNSAGMLLQSIGGGGGTGGAAYSGSGNVIAGVTISLGGSGGGGAPGGQVSALNLGTISTGVAQPTSGFVSTPTIDGNDSAGIVAQSIGGGGGHGGSAVAKSLTIQAPDVPATMSLNLSLGGSGGTAANGGAASATNQGSVATYGDGSTGVYVESVGGGGGDGGDSTAASEFLSTSAATVGANLTFGGNGSAGGNGGGVEALNYGVSDPSAASIFTQGQNAVGMLVQSIGGGGGNGGFGTAKTDTPTLGSESSSYILTLKMGSQAGAGGLGGNLYVISSGSITTQGSGSQGIVAQTIGGGGGNSGGGSSSASNNNITLNLTIGANGAHGGNAAQSQSIIQNAGIITTSGGDGTGILAQAIGGGGGNAGSSDATASIGTWGNLTGLLTSSFKYSSDIAVGGKGGAGGLGGWLSVGNFATGADETTAKITTSGERAYGIVAQSIGGGGGMGGAATALSNSTFLSPLNRNVNFETTLALGGAGGAGSDGGTVNTYNTGVISTSGFSSHGMVAQSIGGGGGVAADGSLDIKANLGLGIIVDESGGAASSGGTITLTQNGKITTTGIDSIGALAQSVGGGGGLGSAGSFYTHSFNGSGATSIGVDATLGFHLNNSTASNGGAVTVSNGPDTANGHDPLGGVIQTTGDWSHGIVAQSIGAGGGKASTIYGTSGDYYPDLAVQMGGSEGTGNGGTVSGTLTGGSITTGTSSGGVSSSGYSAFGFVAQSIGGGGGLFSDASTLSDGMISLGGTTGVSGNGGSTTLETTGSATAITTNGYGAHGIILQSIGGGGGIAGTGSSSLASNAIGAGVTVGGNNAKGDGGNVTVNNSLLNVTTIGDNSYGVIAQSIGGGGGIATSLNGTAPGDSVNTGNASRLGASNASAESNGGAVNVTLSNGSQITTSGLASHALVVQSIGGGGGIANPYVYAGGTGGLTTSGITNDSKALGYGGDVNVNVDANITTTGAGSYGIIAQTIGGGGGIFGNYAGSTGSATSSGTATLNGTTTVTQAGSITTTGQNSVGIFAQNTTASGSGNTVSVTVNGSVTGASAGVWVADGRANSVTVGSGGVLSSATGNAVLYTGSQSINVTNDGTINGSVNLGNSSNILTNNGTFNSGQNVLGSARNTLSGTLDPGGNGAATHTTFQGNLGTDAGSTLKFDFLSATQNDQILFSGPTFGASLNTDTNFVADFRFNLVVGEYDYLLIGTGNNFYGSHLDANLQLENVNLPTGNTLFSSLFVDTSDDSLHLLLAVVPEPSPVLLLLVGSVGLVLAQMIRKRIHSQQ